MCRKKQSRGPMENRRLSLGDRTRSIVAGRDVAGSDQKIIRAAQMRSSGLFVAVCVGGLTHSPHGSRCVFVRLGPRSRVGILRSVDLRNGRNHPMQARCRSARQTTKTGQFGRGSGPLRLLSFALRFLRQPSRPKPPDAGDRPTGHCAWRSGAIVCFSAALIRACRSQGDIN